MAKRLEDKLKEDWGVHLEIGDILGMSNKEVEAILKDALGDPEAKATSEKFVEMCHCGKEKDVGLKCWWCGSEAKGMTLERYKEIFG